MIIRCPACDKKIVCPPGAGGKKGKCPDCGAVFVLPSPATAPEPPPPEPEEVLGDPEVVPDESEGFSIPTSLDDVVPPPPPPGMGAHG